MPIPNIRDLRSPPTVGRYYLVPCVFYVWNNEDGWWPVLGPLHEDKQFFNFPWKHYHLDLRFLDAKQHRVAAKAGWYRSYIPGVSNAEIAVNSQPLFRHDAPPHHKPELRRRRCRQNTRAWAFPHEKPVLDLKRHYGILEGNPASPIRTKDGRILCPHRKVDLSQYQPDERGIVVCPLHGLEVRCG